MTRVAFKIQLSNVISRPRILQYWPHIAQTGHDFGLKPVLIAYVDTSLVSGITIHINRTIRASSIVDINIKMSAIGVDNLDHYRSAVVIRIHIEPFQIVLYGAGI